MLSVEPSMDSYHIEQNKMAFRFALLEFWPFADGADRIFTANNLTVYSAD